MSSGLNPFTCGTCGKGGRTAACGRRGSPFLLFPPFGQKRLMVIGPPTHIWTRASGWGRGRHAQVSLLQVKVPGVRGPAVVAGGGELPGPGSLPEPALERCSHQAASQASGSCKRKTFLIPRGRSRSRPPLGPVSRGRHLPSPSPGVTASWGLSAPSLPGHSQAHLWAHGSHHRHGDKLEAWTLGWV